MIVPTGLQGPTALAYFGGKVKHKIENECGFLIWVDHFHVLDLTVANLNLETTTSMKLVHEGVSE